ncbi:MAG: hypothetical protein L0191_01840, partial [Acidobacteria bacterium]|nr:hypothetical protein [Acidobacteriota bacterium]
MPELPEVEIARENLERWLLGRTIVEARVVDRRVLGGQKRAEVERTLNGARVRRVRRRGKYLIWELVGRGEILAHLGMSGKFVLPSSERQTELAGTLCATSKGALCEGLRN